MLKADQLRELIIKPALSDLVMLSDNAVELLVFTCAVESLGGTYLKQIKGPALGIYQMEPNTYNDIWQNFIMHKQSLAMILAINFNCLSMPDEYRIIYDLRFATAMARIHYARVVTPLPAAKDINVIWEYYKEHYNTPAGAAEKEQSLQKYYNFISL